MPAVPDMRPLAGVKMEFSPWQKEARVLVQATQNYMTKNWYKGGSPSFSVLSIVKGNLNYKKKNLSWENLLEWRIGLSTTSNDSLRKVNMTDDMLRLYSKLGYKIYDRMYVTAIAEFQTPLWNTWSQNETKVKTAFFTPIRFNFGPAIEYKPINGLSLSCTPMAYKLVYAMLGDKERVNVNDYGITTGQKLLREMGTYLRVEWKWKPLREIELETNFYLYTNYRQVEVDLQIEADFIINRFLSAHVLLYPRFDNTSRTAGSPPASMQFKELLSLGFSHHFR